jgi:3-methyl-2-oxobutanoate hydroxymethyltransferase
MPTVKDIRRRKRGDTPITMLTAYDAPTAGIIEDAGIDVILVGDSMGNAVMGHDDTLPVTVDEMASRTASVARATDEALVVADMPFLSFGAEPGESIRNCGRMLKEADADAVKLECGPHTVELTRQLTQLGIPVMAHLGLTPQHVNQLGGFFRQGADQESAEQLLDLANQHTDAGAFSLVLEHVPANVAAQITDAIDIPTIGIGAGADTDGQVLVITDILGLGDRSPPFSKQYADLERVMTDAVASYREDVESGAFPAEEHSHVEANIEEFS